METANNIIVATNGLTSPTGRLFQQFLIHRRVKVFSFEHGVTAGICGVQTPYYFEKKQYTDGGDSMICYNRSSFIAMKNNNGKFGGIVAGAPMINKKVKFYRLQRLIGRNFIKGRYNNRVIFFLGLISRNNMLIPPVLINDLEYYNLTKTIVFDVLSELDDQCILKLYPSDRYLDPDPFSKLLNLPKNVKVIQYFEFSELRATADVIILSSAQSTFGWAWSTNCPIIFLELPAKPLMRNVVDLFDRSLFRIDGSSEDWKRDLLSILKLPHRDLLRLWSNKKGAREELKTHIFGPKGNSGKRVADYICKSMVD